MYCLNELDHDNIYLGSTMCKALDYMLQKYKYETFINVAS